MYGGIDMSVPSLHRESADSLTLGVGCGARNAYSVRPLAEFILGDMPTGCGWSTACLYICSQFDL